MDQVLSFDFQVDAELRAAMAFSLLNECGHATLVRTKKCEAGSAIR
jgi:hypothetical protein